MDISKLAQFAAMMERMAEMNKEISEAAQTLETYRQIREFNRELLLFNIQAFTKIVRWSRMHHIDIAPDAEIKQLHKEIDEYILKITNVGKRSGD